MAGRWCKKTRRKLRKGTWRHVAAQRCCGPSACPAASHTWALRVIYSMCVYGMVHLHVPLKISMGSVHAGYSSPPLPSPPLASVTARLVATWEAFRSFLLLSLDNFVADALEKGWNLW